MLCLVLAEWQRERRGEHRQQTRGGRCVCMCVCYGGVETEREGQLSPD